ncbi:MAG: hypothetical protein M1365_10055 [Actinobacteria bacterium]|nr:hypothetical protein [Actinomycetota bacterium]
MKKLVLIDGNAILHRAFHALPPLNNKDGVPTNAVYGFFSMLFKIIGDLKPEYLIVCFDKKAPTFRKQMYVGYQAKRPTMSDDLIPQIELVHKALDRAKIQHFEIDGYEADDLIGTIAKEAVKKDTQVIILSGDRDLLQLVNSHVLMLAPIIGITKMTLFDEEKVKEKYGLKPSQLVDYKALVGDASDNYPGVTGIGPKTASSLLQKYETFENLYAHLSELPDKIALKLATDAEQASLAKKLATILKDAPLKLELEKSTLNKIDEEALKKYLESLGFSGLLKRMPKIHEVRSVKVSEDKKEESNQLNLL